MPYFKRESVARVLFYSSCLRTLRAEYAIARRNGDIRRTCQLAAYMGVRIRAMRQSARWHNVA